MLITTGNRTGGQRMPWDIYMALGDWCEGCPKRSKVNLARGERRCMVWYCFMQGIMRGEKAENVKYIL